MVNGGVVGAYAIRPYNAPKIFIIHHSKFINPKNNVFSPQKRQGKCTSSWMK